MEIRWANIFALILLIVSAVLFFKNGEEIVGFVMSMRNIGPGHTPEEQTIGLIALGLIGVIIVAVVKILTQNNQRNR